MSKTLEKIEQDYKNGIKELILQSSKNYNRMTCKPSPETPNQFLDQSYNELCKKIIAENFKK